MTVARVARDVVRERRAAGAVEVVGAVRVVVMGTPSLLAFSGGLVVRGRAVGWCGRRGAGAAGGWAVTVW
ncbi:hypothetical protein C8046_00030 [Serinibacter arcticus]|uniref:Uncharacterized protein n=1 Tax=Serinibacter arcticus TaxID=1655435 RepID=A0A2U2A094_9MICO|nr:hypothetical protein C8046_00030 [Serinibacter arcticus]